MRLLLTLARPSEVSAALAARPDLLDVKDPAAGSLGAPDPDLLRSVAARVDGRLPLSVPLGDGPHDTGTLARTVRAMAGLRIDPPAREAGGGEPRRVRPAYLKVGLLGATPETAVRLLAAASRALGAAGASARLVAVTFADAERGRAPSPERLPEIAIRGGADAVMLDTLGKVGGSVLERLGRERLGRWSEAGRRRGLETAVAGGLDACSIPRLVGLGLDVVGVRGGACGNGRRTGRLEPARCRALGRAVREARTPGNAPPAAPRPGTSSASAAPGQTSSVEIAPASSPRTRATRAG